MMQLGLFAEARLLTRRTETLEVEMALALIVLVPSGVCPECGYGLDEEEVCAGWHNDPLDFTTRCPKCGQRFIAHLHARNQKTGLVESFDYLCPEQLFWKLKVLIADHERQLLGKVFLSKNDRCALFNLIRHFGSYKRGRAAFSRWLKARA